jgi:hypothetical protein
MSQRLKRIRKRVNNNELQKRRAALPPVRELLREAQILRETFPDDPKVIAICNAFEQTTAEKIADGYVLREGGGAATKPVPLPKELRPYAAQWEKPPPEKP